MPIRESAWPAGTPCWIDYGAADLEAAKSFYAQLLGWTYSGGEPEYGGYLTCQANGHAAAGMAPRMDPTSDPTWMTYFATDDVDASLERVTQHGGTVVAPVMQVGSMGRMAIALDPQDHAFGLWEADQHTGVTIFNEPGSLVWNEAAVEDYEAAKPFYAAVFGWTYQPMEGAESYSTFATQDRPLGGLGQRQGDAPGGWSTCFSVSSTDEAVTTVERQGGKVLMPAQDRPYGRFAVVSDPWGAPLSVMEGTSG